MNQCRIENPLSLLNLSILYRLLTAKQAELIPSYKPEQILSVPVARIGRWFPSQLDWRFCPVEAGGDLFQVTNGVRICGNDVILDMSGHGIGAAFTRHFVIQSVSEDRCGFTSEVDQTHPLCSSEDMLTDQGEYFTIWLGFCQWSATRVSDMTAENPVSDSKDEPGAVLGAKSWPIGFCPGRCLDTRTMSLGPVLSV